MKNKRNLTSREQYLKTIRKKNAVILIFQIAILAGFLILWQILADAGVLNAFVFSSPKRIVSTLGTLFAGGELWHHIFITFYEALVAFLISTAIGFAVAVILWWNETLHKIFEPYLIILNSLPKIALGPIIIIWFGAGTKAIVVMAILIMVIITAISLLNAFVGCDRDKILLMNSMGANKLQILTKLVIPNAMGEFVSVLKINVGMTWVGTIMGEYLVSKAGLGYLIVYGSQVFKLDIVMTSILVLCVLAGLMYLSVCLLEKLLKK